MVLQIATFLFVFFVLGDIRYGTPWGIFLGFIAFFLARKLSVLGPSRKSRAKKKDQDFLNRRISYVLILVTTGTFYSLWLKGEMNDLLTVVLVLVSFAFVWLFDLQMGAGGKGKRG